MNDHDQMTQPKKLKFWLVDEEPVSRWNKIKMMRSRLALVLILTLTLVPFVAHGYRLLVAGAR